MRIGGVHERRHGLRARTRLRPGKILDEAGRHVADCAILDRSAGGVRIRLFEPLEIAGPIRLVDERERASFEAELAWQRDAQAGLRTLGSGLAMERGDFTRAAGPYYAVR